MGNIIKKIQNKYQDFSAWVTKPDTTITVDQFDTVLAVIFIAGIVLGLFLFGGNINTALLQGNTIPVFSGGGLQEGANLVNDNIEGLGIVESTSIIDTIVWIIKWVLILSGILALFAFIWAGFLYITTFVNEENNETAKKVMIYAAIGILIIIFSWVIVSFLTTFTL